MRMRTITFVDRLALDFGGNISGNAIGLGDVDNDGNNELVVGNARGDLVIFKGTGSKPWKHCSGLGHITAICIGDLLNLGRNVLVVTSGDGWCYVLDLEDTETNLDSSDPPSTPVGDETPNFFQGDESWDSERGDKIEVPRIYPAYKQRIPANVKELLIGDYNDDGFLELVLTLTDRVVRTYRWRHAGSDLNSTKISGRLAPIHKWELANQIGSTTLNRNRDGSPVLLVSQPGGAFLRLKCMSSETKAIELEDEETPELLSKMSLDYEPLDIDNMRNFNVSAEILGDLVTGQEKEGVSSPYAIATLDGTLMTIQDEKIVWSMQVDHQLFCLTKLDVNGDGREELIVSSWDGHTYIMSQDQRGVEFIFEESVAAFTSGLYSIDGEKVPVLVFVTFTNKVYIYYNIKLTQGISLKTLVGQPETDNLRQTLEEMGIDPNDRKTMEQFNKFMLYSLAGVQVKK